MTDAKKKTLALVAEIDPEELTIRLLEISCSMKRPPGRSASDLMAEQRRLAERDPIAAQAIQAHEAMAREAINFMVEKINAGQQPV